MLTNDYHAKYYHPHYLLAAKLYVQSDGSILVLTGNIKLEMSHDELHAFICGVLELSNMFKALHNDVTGIEAQGENNYTGRG